MAVYPARRYSSWTLIRVDTGGWPFDAANKNMFGEHARTGYLLPFTRYNTRATSRCQCSTEWFYQLGRQTNFSSTQNRLDLTHKSFDLTQPLLFHEIYFFARLICVSNYHSAQDALDECSITRVSNVSNFVGYVETFDISRPIFAAQSKSR